MNESSGSICCEVVTPFFDAAEPAEAAGELVDHLEEGLAALDGLMRGQPFSFEGAPLPGGADRLLPPGPPVQQPRVPVWVVGASPSKRSLLRAARWDGLVPNVVTDEGPWPASGEELRGIIDKIISMPAEVWDTHSRFDVIADGTTPQTITVLQ